METITMYFFYVLPFDTHTIDEYIHVLTPFYESVVRN